MKIALSVVLCTHNPRPDYFSRVLASLRGQSLPHEQWEFLLVDNASEQPLSEIWDLSWHARGRHVREDELGLTSARLRGIQESSGELLVFVDDDNLLAADFLEKAMEISAQNPILGAFGAGVLEPEFEVEPPVELQPRLHLLALRNTPSAHWSIDAKDVKCRPFGAGLCVTRRVANSYQQFVADLGIMAVLDRKGERLFSGGDEVFSWVAAELNLGFGVFPELRITHLISAGRLTRQYFLRLIHDHALSRGVLACRLDEVQRRRNNPFWYVRLLFHAVKSGLFSMRCQWAESRGEDRATRFISAKAFSILKNTLDIWMLSAGSMYLFA